MATLRRGGLVTTGTKSFRERIRSGLEKQKLRVSSSCCGEPLVTVLPGYLGSCSILHRLLYSSVSQISRDMFVTHELFIHPTNSYLAAHGGSGIL